MQNLTYFSPKTEKRASAIEGRGLFAISFIQKGEVVVVKGGYILTTAQRDVIAKTLGPAEIQIADDLFIGPTTLPEKEGGMMHLNHSCEPNLGLQGQIVFVAMRDIAAGEELTFDYAMTDNEFYEEISCRCGTTLCRKSITGFDWKLSELQRRYQGYFSAYIQHKIDTLL